MVFLEAIKHGTVDEVKGLKIFLGWNQIPEADIDGGVRELLDSDEGRGVL